MAEDCPCMGWSAGANVVCPTLRVPNDMPILSRKVSGSSGLVLFRSIPITSIPIPKATQGKPGRCALRNSSGRHPQGIVLGLWEGTGLVMKGSSIHPIGSSTLRLFKNGRTPVEIFTGENSVF